MLGRSENQRNGKGEVKLAMYDLSIGGFLNKKGEKVNKWGLFFLTLFTLLPTASLLVVLPIYSHVYVNMDFGLK